VRCVSAAAATIERGPAMRSSARNATVISLVALAALAGLPTEAAGAKGRVLKSITPGKNGIQYQAVCEPCEQGHACLSVLAVGKGVPTARLVLEDDSQCRGASASGTELSARKFELAPNLTGVLFKQESGGEAIAHSYWLVAIIDGKLTLLWKQMYSTHEVVSIDSYRLNITDRDGNARQEIDYLAPFPVTNDAGQLESALRANEPAADTWEHQVLEFSDAGKAMVDKTPHEEYAAVLVSTKNLVDALKLKLSLLKDARCNAKDFLVLDSKTLPKLREGFYVVAGVSESRAAATETLKKVQKCRSEIAGAIRQVR
jgi:hypothetical protein